MESLRAPFGVNMIFTSFEFNRVMPQSCTPCKNDAQGQRFCYVMSCTVQIIALHTVRYRPNDNVILSSQSITLFYNMTAISKEELLEAGLEVAGFKGWQKCKLKTNVERFKALFGTTPAVCKMVWDDMETSASKMIPLHLLLALRYLKAYPLEVELLAMFKMSKKTVRKWYNIGITEIQKLKSKKVRTVLDSMKC